MHGVTEIVVVERVGEVDGVVLRVVAGRWLKIKVRNEFKK